MESSKNKILCVGVSLLLISAMLAFPGRAHAHSIDMEILAEIESSNNPKACSYRGCKYGRGLFQISEIVLKQHNERAKRLGLSIYDTDDLFYPAISQHIASTYLNWLEERCDSVDEILIAWNFGIGNLRKYQQGEKKLPKETKDFLEKYHKISEV